MSSFDEFQKSTGDAAKYVKEAPFFYYQEHQAYLEQQRFLKRVVADQGIEAVATNERSAGERGPRKRSPPTLPSTRARRAIRADSGGRGRVGRDL